MIHKSKKDRWLVVLYLGSPAIQLSIGVYLFASGARAVASWSLLGGGLLMVAGFLLFVYPMRYVVREMDLLIQSGRVRWRIPYSRIAEVKPARIWLSGPAWSLDRLLVSYHQGSHLNTILISPEDKDSFLSDLTATAPALKRSGDGLKPC